MTGSLQSHRTHVGVHLSLLIPLFATGCDNTNKGAHPDLIKPAATSPVESNKTGSILDDVSLPEGWRERANALLDQAAALGGDALTEAGKAWEIARDTASEYITITLDQAVARARDAGALIDVGLEKLAMDPTATPTTEERAARLAIKLIPFLGPTETYASARALYRNGIERKDAEQCLKAKRKCLLACAELGLDVIPLSGKTKVIEKGATVAEDALRLLKFEGLAARLADLKHLNLLDTVLDAGLAQPIVDRAIEMALGVEFRSK